MSIYGSIDPADKIWGSQHVRYCADYPKFYPYNAINVARVF